MPSFSQKSTHQITFVFLLATALALAAEPAFAQWKTPAVDGTIATGEYGNTASGTNQIGTSTSQTWYMTWDAANLYIGITNANLAEAAVVYIGTGGSGSGTGFNYDGTSFSSLPFPAQFVAYVKDGYNEYRTSTGGNWSSQTANALNYASNASNGNTREFAIPWAAITGGGLPAQFNFFGYLTSSGGYVYGQVPNDNPGAVIGTSAQYTHYYQVTSTANGASTPPFSNEQPVTTGQPTVRIHYYRPDGNYSGWALYTWNASTENNSWCSSEVPITNTDSFGVYFDVTVNYTQGTPPGDLGFIINNCAAGQIKDPGPDQHLQTTLYSAAWVISGDAMVFTSQPTQQEISNALLNTLQAYWLDRQRIAIQPQHLQSGNSYALTTSLTGGLNVTAGGITGGTQIPLTPGGSLTQDELNRYPQLASYAVLTIPSTIRLATLQSALKGELAVSAVDASGKLQYATGVQSAGVLDDLYYYGGKLGVVFRQDDPCWQDWNDDDNGDVKIKLWAPTAQQVGLQIFDHATDTAPSATLAMHEHNGVWVATGDQSWTGKYYLYSVKVWVQSDAAVDTNITTDPYSIDIAVNGAKSRITDLDSRETKPSGWDFVSSPPLRSLNDLSLYELHIRDFSVNDPTVPAAHRGMYDAFDDQHSNGMQHLRTLAESGLKAVHILPSFHFSSVNEDKSTWTTTPPLNADPPASDLQQAAVTAIQSSDAYNWGYDPVHYMTPEGSYAIDPDQRVREYRVMVEGLHKAGLRVVQDVVFNHTNASGEGPNSNLDEVVPNYYHRLDANGNLETGSCCADTASEHRMMEKLMIDTLVLNAREYKIDGFRFDIMSFHFTYNMQHIQQALRALTPERDGVDGSKIYLYGEGFNFGDTQNNQIGPNASQVNLYGFGIGTFNDRIRDGIRGGSPFTDERVQGFATGLLTDSSDFTNQSTAQADQKSQLLRYSDWILTGLAGNLRDYSFVSSSGATVKGSQIDYNGQPTAYTATPIEAINYASVHDNQDLFDAVQLKSNLNDSIDIRARRQVLALSLIALCQGIPFFHAADDLLRSKDMDQNSYDSGDWFNKIDWSGRTANWGIGLPIASQNSNQWPIMTPLLSNPAYTPLASDISYSAAAFRDLLQIRSSSGLFHMTSLQDVQSNLLFLNTGPNQIPGLIVMKIDRYHGTYDGYQHILVVFNATTSSVTFTDSRLQGSNLRLHPVQRHSSDATTTQSKFDSATGSATVPALTTAVFINEAH
jgi:pullulanase